MIPYVISFLIILIIVCIVLYYYAAPVARNEIYGDQDKAKIEVYELFDSGNKK